MFRTGEKVYDNSLKKYVIVTAELREGMNAVDPDIASTRWTAEPMEDAEIVEPPKEETTEDPEGESTPDSNPEAEVPEGTPVEPNDNAGGGEPSPSNELEVNSNPAKESSEAPKEDVTPEVKPETTEEPKKEGLLDKAKGLVGL